MCKRAWPQEQNRSVGPPTGKVVDGAEPVGTVCVAPSEKAD
jgi:hypothetical protein